MGTQLLDLGWTRARLGAAQLDPESAVHIALAEGAHYGVEKRRKAVRAPPAPYIALTHAHIHTAFCTAQAFKHGEAETMGAHAAAARLRDTLAEMRAAPVLLLVHDEPAARAALHDLGIETSTWASGADALLRSVRAFPRSRLPVCLSDRNHVSVSASIFVSGSGGSVSCWMGDWPPILTHSRRRTAAVDRHRSGSILALCASHVALHYTSYSAGLVKHEADRRPPYRDERSYDRRPHDSRAPYRNEDRGNGRRDGYGYDYDRGRDRSYVSSSRDERAPARRSRSPHRDRDRTRDRRDDHARERDRARGPSSRSRSRERDGPAGAGADGGVYVVDVRVLFDALTQTARTRRTIGADARDAGGREAGEGEWCAGNESWCVLSTLFLFFCFARRRRADAWSSVRCGCDRVLAELWYAMAAGEAIDEQRAARWPDGLGSGGPAAAGGAGGRSGDATEDVDPNDVDPNDIEPARKAPLTLLDDFDMHDSEEERGDAQYTY